MFNGKSIAISIPAYNEEKLIAKVLTTMPDYVDYMIVVNDGSKDGTLEVIEAHQQNDSRIIIVDHKVNQGLGQSLIDGYLKARELKADITAVMAGDAQMAPADLESIITPIAEGTVDYVKGNRLLREEVIERMPRHRFIGNSVLTLLTKFATGYWKIIDPQCGYTAISLRALNRIPIQQMTKGYGYNADILNMLNLNNYKVCDVEIEPVYGDEQSKIKLSSYIPKVSCLLLRLFAKRITYKYFVREFNPLIFFYMFSLFNGIILGVPLTVRFFWMYLKEGQAPTTTLIILTFTYMMAFFSLFFAMWLDMEDNRRLSGDV